MEPGVRSTAISRSFLWTADPPFTQEGGEAMSEIMQIEWHSRDDKPDFFDGDQYLVIVGVVDDSFGKRREYSEFSVVTIKCDEGFFGIECEGEPWGWEWDSVEYWAKLKSCYPPSFAAKEAASR